jgi:hypothetical protein
MSLGVDRGVRNYCGRHRFRGENVKFPLPKIEPAAGVEKRFPRAQLKITQHFPMFVGPAKKAGGFPTVDLETETEAVPALGARQN